MGFAILFAFVLGLALLSYGLSLIYPPLLFISLGLGCLLTALLTRQGGRR